MDVELSMQVLRAKDSLASIGIQPHFASNAFHSPGKLNATSLGRSAQACGDLRPRHSPRSQVGKASFFLGEAALKTLQQILGFEQFAGRGAWICHLGKLSLALRAVAP